MNSGLANPPVILWQTAQYIFTAYKFLCLELFLKSHFADFFFNTQASYAGLALVGGFFAYKAFKGESLDNAAGDLKVCPVPLHLFGAAEVCCI